MSPSSKHIIDVLLAGGYLTVGRHLSGLGCFRLSDKDGNPVQVVSIAAKKSIDRNLDPKIKMWRRDKSGRITFNRSSILRMHGRSYLKKQYKKLKKAK